MPLLVSLPLRLLLSALGLAAAALPRGLEVRLGRALGRAMLRLGLFRHRVAKANIDLALPEFSSSAREQLLADNYEHYGILFFEFAHFFCPLPGHWRRYAQENSRLVNRHLWEQAAAKGRGVLFFSSHMGMWEMSAAAAGLAGLKPVVVTKVLKPAWLDRRITACRASTEVTAAYHPGSMPAVLRALRKGGSAAFMNDQYARPPMGLPVDFFGQNVDTLSVIGPLAKRTGAAVVPVSTLRGRDGIVTVLIEPELDLGACADDAEAATQLIAKHVEGWVRQEPAQWLWLHRRFKNAVPAPARVPELK
jgi:KDO2-lipid IV(A) lauroyltransferase